MNRKIEQRIRIIGRARKDSPGVRTWYVRGKSGETYGVQHVRGFGWRCQCDDYFWRCWIFRLTCVHIRHVKRNPNRKIAAEPRGLVGLLRKSLKAAKR